MNIIIIGCGKVGYNIAKFLSNEKHNITLIDKKEEALEKINDAFDILPAKANGLSSKDLKNHGIETADLVISVTNSDETNILCCLVAKKLGAKYTIARVRDPEYTADLGDIIHDLDIDMIINPELQAAMEISRLLRFPSAAEIDTFIGGRVELIFFKIPKNHEFSERPVSKIFQRLKSTVLVATVIRDDESIIPNGSFILLEGDIIGIMGRPSEITSFFHEIGNESFKIRDTMIIGGGKITYYLTEILLRHKINIKIVEIDNDKCDELSERFTNCVIINGDGTDENILNEENIQDVDSVVCLTDRDEENIIIALYARQYDVKKTVVKINHIRPSLAGSLGVDSIVNPANSTSYQIIRFVRGLINSEGRSNIRTMYRIAPSSNDNVEAMEFHINPSCKITDVPIKDLSIRKDVLIGCILRDGNIIIASGKTELRTGDDVIIIAKNMTLIDIEDIIDE